MEKELYSFVFKGLLTEAALDRTERVKPQISDLDPIVAERLSLDLLDEAFVLRAKRMATVYTVITAFENTVREFLSKILLEASGESWWDTTVSEKIRNKAFSRREEESKVRWHTPRGDALINYTDFGDLTSIIQQNWPLFEAHLHSIEWVRHMINTLERSRNVIMHSGELQNEDIERIGSSIRDWIRQVG
ncbi:Swt1 family HEPN domain-containing protein [Paenibacillus sp. tmac-D7]|uniref:Swt1 family HEPN domain-containing protein n=1 Tax=Paenibacillus sp. tmac-D7 TaxID=2591462 RepID=UPI001144BA0C|nr:Swt1 family HEPN domain-containing protein [Paenibacillus sp. tmac-D7]